MKTNRGLIDNFISVIDSVYGIYLDGTLGFELLNEYILKMQNKSINLLEVGATTETFDEAEFIYGVGIPPIHKNIRNPNLLHITTQRELKERNKKDGLNYKILGNLCIVQIYQFWEDKYREKIALSLNLRKNELKSNIFSELRQMRNSIIHNNGIATSELEKKVKIMNFKRGEEIFIKSNNVRKIIQAIKEYLYSLTNNKTE